MGLSQDYPNVPDWVAKPEGYQTGAMCKYNGNIFYANFWAAEPGVGDANNNGWRFYDELYDLTPHTPTEQAKIIAYIPTWRTVEGFNYSNDEMYRYITHGIVSFLMFSENNPGEFEPKSLEEVNTILSSVVDAGHRNGTRISIALGGAVDFGFLNLMTSVGNNPGDPLLDRAVQNVVSFVNSHNLDGVDLDLECWWGKPGQGDMGGRPKADGPHPAGFALTLFAQKLKQAMPDKLVSAAIFGTSWYGNNYDPKLADYTDWLAIMTYDLTGSWNASPVGPQSALLKIRDQESYLQEQQGKWPDPQNQDQGPVNNPILSVEDTLWYWTNPLFVNWQGMGQNIPRNKIAGGVPIYGYDFAYGKDPDDMSGEIPPGYKVIRYKDLLAQFPDAHTAANGNIKVSGNTPRPPFIKDSGSYPYTHNLYLETPDTAVAKLNFLKDVGAQGVIIWELSNDVWEEGKSIIKALYRNSGNPESRTLIPALPIFGSAPVPKYRIVNVKSRMAITAPTNQGEGTYQSPVDSNNSLQVFEIQKDENTKIRCAGNPSLVLDVQGNSSNDQTPIITWTENNNSGQYFHLEKHPIIGSAPTKPSKPDPFWRGRYIINPNSFALNPTSFRIAVSGGSTKANAPIVQDAQFGFFGVTLEDDQIWDLYEVVNDVSSNMITAQGDNSYYYCLCNRASSNQQGDISNSHPMNIEAGAPYFYAVLTKDDDTVDFPTGAILTIQGTDGTKYDRDIQEENLLVIMSGSSVRCFIVKDPTPGTWMMTMAVPEGVGFHCECNTVPSKDVYDTITAALSTTNQLQKRDLFDSDSQGWYGAAAAYLSILTASKDENIKLAGEFLGAAVGSSTSIEVATSSQTPTRTSDEATTLSAAASITSTRRPLVTEGDALEQYVMESNENMGFEILDSNGASTYTSYLRWIAAIRTRFGGTALFAVRIQIEDRQSPWIRINASTLYLEAFSTADNPFIDNNWQIIPTRLITYPDPNAPESAAIISYATIIGAIDNASNTNSDLTPTTVVILAFTIAEAARFDAVAFAVDNVLRGYVEYNWYYFRPLLVDWSFICRNYYNTTPRTGVSIAAAARWAIDTLGNAVTVLEVFKGYLSKLVQKGYPRDPKAPRKNN
jgi:GH18 family chitinase